MTADLINGIFETCGGIFVLLSCFRLYRDRTVKGVSPTAVCFFTLWGIWNLYFYPAVGAWMSFYGGIGVTVANLIWMGMFLYFKYVRMK